MVIVLLIWLALTGASGWLSITLSGFFADTLETLHELLVSFL